MTLVGHLREAVREWWRSREESKCRHKNVRRRTSSYFCDDCNEMVYLHTVATRFLTPGDLARRRRREAFERPAR